MRAIIRPAAAAFGLANLYLLALTGPLVSSAHDLVYHLTGSASVIFIPVLIYLLVLWLVWFGALVLADRSVWLHRVIWSAAVLALPWILVGAFMGFLDSTVPVWVSTLIALASLILFLAVVFVKPLQKVFEAAQPLAETVLIFFSLFGVMIFCQLLYFGWQERNLNPAPRLHQERTVMQPKPRIIWIVLDELSYDQVYGRRLPGLQLPAFDQLAAESAVFTHVKPAGKFTRQVLPSLLTGVPTDKIRVNGAGLLAALHDPSSGKWQGFDEQKTVFQDALDAGYSTGLAGWYNPYCRILPAVLDRCYWMYREDTPAMLSPDASVASNLVMPFQRLVARVRHFAGDGSKSPSEGQQYVHIRSADYEDLMRAGDALIDNPSIDFILIHQPIPHPPGFYDWRNHRVGSNFTSYIGNLALADLYLGHVRAELEQEGEWDAATVVVMGDHSWRTTLIWENSPGWTAEDQVASHGGEFDDRPAYIVKLPYEHTGFRIDDQFSALRTRSLFDAMIRGRMTAPLELQQWVQQK